MQRVLWPIGLAVAFGLGLFAPRLGDHAGETDRLRAEIGRLEREATALRARLRAGEPRPSAALAASVALPPAPQAVQKRPIAAAPTASDAAERPRRTRRGGSPEGDAQDDLTAGRSARAPRGSASTVEAALDRFNKYLAAINAPAGPDRWRQVRDQTNELKAMGDTGTKALMGVLSNAEASSDERRAAAQLLGQFQAGDALPLLTNILANDEDVLLRRAAASALRRMDSPDTVPAMQALLMNPEEDRFVRMSAAFGLAQQGSPLGITGLEQIFQEANADGRGRDMAFRALASLNDQAALPFMRQLVISDAEVSYRLQAIRFLAGLNDAQALGPLQMVMQSPTEQPSIRDAAALAYATISRR